MAPQNSRGKLEEKVEVLQQGRKPVLVELAKVTRGPIEKSSSVPHHLRPRLRWRSTPARAIRRSTLLVEEGDKVEKGRCSCGSRMIARKNDYDQAKSQLDKEQIDFARQENLYKDNLISEQDFATPSSRCRNGS